MPRMFGKLFGRNGVRGTGAATPTVGIGRSLAGCAMRLTTPKVHGSSFRMGLGRGNSLRVGVRGGRRPRRRRRICLHHRFSCTGFRRALVLPSSIGGRGVSTDMTSNILAVRLPGVRRRRRGVTHRVSVKWIFLIDFSWTSYLIEF